MRATLVSASMTKYRKGCDATKLSVRDRAAVVPAVLKGLIMSYDLAQIICKVDAVANEKQ